MAASEVTLEDNTEDAFESSEENETSLKEIKGLLEGVQKTLLIMQTENRRMAAELTELKSSFSKQSTEISSLQSALKKAQNENDELKRSVVSLKKKIEDHEGEINELYSQQDDLEQIHRLPENLYSSTANVVIKLGERLNVSISNEDIDISHKLYNGKNNPTSITVKFTSHQKQTQLYRKRTELKNVKVSDLFSDGSASDSAQIPANFH